MQNPYRIFANNEYCHSCGPHVHDGHNSATCKMPGPNHNRNATLANPLGGSCAGAHKNVMPEQCGRTADCRPQPDPSPAYLAWRASGFQGTRGAFYKQFKKERNGQQQQKGGYQQAHMMQQAPMQMMATPQMMAPQQVMQPQHMQMMQQPIQMMAPMIQGGMLIPQQQPMQQQQQMQQQQKIQQPGQQQVHFAGFGAGAPMGRNF